MRALVIKWSLRLLFSILLVLSGNGASAETKDVTRATLSNGLRVVIVRNTLAPVATTMVNYLVGSNETPEGFPGTAHALEHMMFRGSPGLSASQLATLIGAMGGSFNAETQQTVTQYFFTVPVEDLETALRIESIRMRDLLSSEDLWTQERGAIEQEVSQDLSNPMYLFHTRLLQHLFEGTPYSKDALGSRASFEKTTGADLRSFHKQWYVPNNAILVIVGDVDAAKTLSLVRDLFQEIPSRSLPEKSQVSLRPLQAKTIELETDLPYGLSIVAYRFPGYRSPDYPAAQVLADALSSERGNLYGTVVQGKSLASGFEANFLPDVGMAHAYEAFPMGGDGPALVSTIKGIVDGYLKDGIPSELVEASKRSEVASAEYGKNSMEGLAGLWSQVLALEGRNSPEEDIEAIRKVTVEDVNRVARKYLLNQTAVVGVLKPHPSGRAQETHTFRGTESFAPNQAERVALPDWAKKVSAPAAMPVSNVNPFVSVLPNGLRLIVQRETISPSISIFGAVKHQEDMETPKGKEGVAGVLDMLFSFGTSKLDRIAFLKAVDEIGAELSTGANFTLQVLTQHFDRGVELLAANLLDPALPEDAFRVIQQEKTAAVAGQLQSPGYLSRKETLKAIYPQDDPTLREPTPQSVSSLTLSDIKGYYGKVFRPDLTFIVVVGNVTEEQAKRTIEKHFGQWKAKGPKPEIDLPPVPLNKQSQRVVPDRSRVQDAVILAETLGLCRSDPDYYPLQMGNHVLSGAFYATRLYHELREKTGLVYSVSSALSMGKTRGNFEVAYACDPANVSKAREMVVRILEDMRSAPVSPEELQQAKTILLKEIPLSESSVEGIGQRLLSLALLDLPLNEPFLAAKRYSEITAEQVQVAFSKWVRPQDLAQVVLGPNPQ
ncbi:MAG: insulinase family protein [Desulfobacteraceae bacterium]|nr:MAG: insulinase family protein [Desulfobacteraceae bacterium]